MPAARNGLAIMRCAVLVSWPSAGSGSARVPESIFRSAPANASGSLLSRAPDASAWYSRLRLMASWMSVAAIGPMFLAAIRQSVNQRSLALSTRHLEITSAPLGPETGLIGAGVLAMREALRTGSPA